MPVHVDLRPPVAVVTLDRPEVRNAVDRPTAEALADALRTLDDDDSISVLVLTGAGGTFCAGADLKAFATGDANRLEPHGDGPMGATRMVLRKPLIAAIEGHAVAGGLELACLADLRVAADDAVLGVFCRRFGVPLIDGGTVRLPRLIGLSHALDLILTGRAVSADEAHRMGLVNRVAPRGEALETAISLARQLAALPQTCMRADLASARQAFDRDLPAAMGHEFEGGMLVVQSGETLAGATRFAEGAGRHGEDA